MIPPKKNTRVGDMHLRKFDCGATVHMAGGLWEKLCPEKIENV
jgi:hypothetical protein